MTRMPSQPYSKLSIPAEKSSADSLLQSRWVDSQARFQGYPCSRYSFRRRYLLRWRLNLFSYLRNRSFSLLNLSS
uniref:Uncharacterized protein n=1 Tax=Picea glauca TaxID=3330 RepID=A0A101LUU3_PICGL|nr:hypothetical protein ABT39_MTgene2316 [Picea glauca]QHR89293.1 hypothetical protein Q903MT_gene3314 [Picea sitchensis]